MREKSRVFGNNMRYLMKKQDMSEQQVAEQLGYTEYEVCKILDGRVLLDTSEREQIAECLRTDVKSMLLPLEEEQYSLAGCMECRGKFSDMENKKKILDIFDLYCDIQEALQEI